MSQMSWEALVMSLAQEEEKDFATVWRDKIEMWLQEEAWTVGHQVATDTKWVILARDGQGRPVSIVQPSANKDMLVIGLGIAIDESLRGQISALHAPERRNLIFDLHEGAILMGVQYAGLAEPLHEFLLESSCYLSELSKTTLLERIKRVRDTSLLLVDRLHKAVNRPPVEEPQRRPVGFRPLEN